jgi:sec-independent protein translocase protein TatC
MARKWWSLPTLCHINPKTASQYHLKGIRARRAMTAPDNDPEQIKLPVATHEVTEEQFNAQSLTDHLRDLRSCLIISLAAIVVGFAGAYNYVEAIGVWFFKPLTDVLPQGSSLIFTSYQEGFFFI